KDEAVKTAMIEEARTFITKVVFEGDGLLSTLLTADYSYVNQPLAPLYGKTAQGMDYKQMMFDPAQRSGIVTQLAFLTVTGAPDGSNPARRGHRVMDALLCEELPPPPANVPPIEPVTAGGTTRSRFEKHSAMKCAET